MKLACACGFVIADNTDYLPYVGHLIADQDIQDVYEMPSPGGFRHLLTRKMYQCRSCGRLWIEGQGKGQMKAFVPEQPAPDILSSIHGQSWKRVLRGSWTDEALLGGLPRGFLTWTHLSEGDRATFDDWDLLQQAYFERLEELRRQGILRDALLMKNGQAIHSWSSSPKANEEPEKS